MGLVALPADVLAEHAALVATMRARPELREHAHRTAPDYLTAIFYGAGFDRRSALVDLPAVRGGAWEEHAAGDVRGNLWLPAVVEVRGGEWCVVLPRAWSRAVRICVWAADLSRLRANPGLAAAIDELWDVGGRRAVVAALGDLARAFPLPTDAPR